MPPDPPSLCILHAVATYVPYRQTFPGYATDVVLVTVVLLSCVQTGTTQCDGKSVFCIYTATLYHQITVHCTVEAISAAVLEALMPVLNETRSGVEAIKRDLEEHKLYVNRTASQRIEFMNETRSGVEAIRRDLSNLEDNMNRNKDDLGQRLDRVEDRLVDMNKKILVTQSVVERSLNESMTTVNEESLTDHLTKICDKMDRINSRIISVSSAINGKIDSKLDLLDSKQDKLDMKVMSVNSELEQNILTNITKQLKKTSESSQEALGSCGGEGWTRVVYLDMTDPNTTCPSGWRYNPGYPKRTCSTGHLTCDSVFFPVSGGAYTSVCGRIKGYQNSRTDAFEVYHNGDATTIEEPYVSGVSLTHGSPRQHIWTFAASATSSYTNIEACPCNSTTHRTTPPFVGGDYFCESGVNSGSPRGFFPDDPLWDGDVCAVSSTCCPFNNPPYFTKRLSNTTTDDLEVRLCWWDNEDETPIELIELYVAFGELNTKEPHHNVLINTQQLSDMISSKMELLNVSMREEFRAVERQFQEHKNQTISELSDLQTSLQSTHTDHLTKTCGKMDAMHLVINAVSSAINGTIDSKLDLLDSKQNELDMKVMSVNSELEKKILTNITKQLKKTSQSSQEALGSCGGEGWRRVAYLDMTDPDTTCPSGWREMTRDSKRTCDRFSTSSLICDSVFFHVSGGAYTTVCGRIRAYQFGSTDAFESYHDGQATTIDEPYVSGVSLTHGSPRQHIWTFAAGITEANHRREDACPCDDTVTISIPPFVGEDYFCESGTNSGSSSGFHPYDPLWDGKNCTSTSTCCSFNNPPYFTKRLPSPTTHDLEVRLCLLDGGEDAPIEFIELYVGLGEMNTRALYQNLLSNTQNLTHMISSKMDVIDSRLASISSAINDNDLQEAEQNIVTNVTKETQKMSNSLHEVMEELEQNISNTVRNELYDHVHEDLGEFERDVLSNVTTQLNDLAENNDLHNHVCGSTRGWTRAIYLDMTPIPTVPLAGGSIL